LNCHSECGRARSARGQARIRASNHAGGAYSGCRTAPAGRPSSGNHDGLKRCVRGNHFRHGRIDGSERTVVRHCLRVRNVIPGHHRARSAGVCHRNVGSRAIRPRLNPRGSRVRQAGCKHAGLPDCRPIRIVGQCGPARNSASHARSCWGRRRHNHSASATTARAMAVAGKRCPRRL